MADIKQLCSTCQQERKQFTQQRNKASPGCAAIWRLACTKDEAAWSCWLAIFAPWVEKLSWIEIKQAPPGSGLSGADALDLAQDVWHNLWRYMKNNSAAAQQLIAADDDLSRVIGLIKTTIKKRGLEICRKERVLEVALLDTENPFDEVGEVNTNQLPRLEAPKPEPVLDLLDFLRKHIQTLKEKVIAEVIFLQGMKPQDVLDLHPKLFVDLHDVNRTRQNLVRRMRSDPARQNFVKFASLPIRNHSDDEVPMALVEPCPFNEGILIDYLHGHLVTEMRTTIEHSPACMAVVAALQADLVAWQPALRQLFCPTSERLVDYQEGRITGTDRLVVHQHIQHCPYCQAEIAMLEAVDVEPPLSWARQIYELIFQPATMSPVPVLGEGTYRTIERTPQIELLIRTSRTSGKQGNWIVAGRLRYADDQPVAQVESVILQDIEEESAPELSTTVDENSRFTFTSLEAGRYRIRILTADEEIVLRELKVGDNA